MCRKGIARLKKIYQWLIWQIIEVLKLRNDDMGYRQISCFIKTIVVVAIAGGFFLKILVISEARKADVTNDGAGAYKYVYMLNKYRIVENVSKVGIESKLGGNYYKIKVLAKINLDNLKKANSNLVLQKGSIVYKDGDKIYIAHMSREYLYVYRD